jgi:16S rRNA (uracil1498-N3)-methyltransferase
VPFQPQRRLGDWSLAPSTAHRDVANPCLAPGRLIPQLSIVSDFRAHAPDVPANAAEIRLGPDESHHLVTVNRCGRGDLVVAFDGHGREWLTECADPSKTATVLRVKEARPAATRTFSITLAQALPKGSTMDEIVRQATEVGAARIIPLLSERTQVHLDGDRADKKIEKWRTTAIEAAKQCGNPWLPEIAPITKFDEFLRWSPLSEPQHGLRDSSRVRSSEQQDTAATGLRQGYGPQAGVGVPHGGLGALSLSNGETDAHPLKLVASLHAGTTTLKKALATYTAKSGHPPRSALWLVGPEGDFSPAEMTAAVMAGFVPVTLGPLVLRSDTAAIYALSILSHELM